jgi:hypothetical protein
LIAAVVIGLLVLAALIVGAILLAGGSDPKQRPVASATASGSSAPSASSNPSASPSASSSPAAGRPPTGLYTCSVGSTPIGTITLTDVTYRSSGGNGGGRGIWSYDKDTNAVTFIGSDLSDFDGRYNTSNGDLELSSKTNNVFVTCKQ